MTDVAITEFEMIDPDELHLVGKGANGFKALLAKSASDEVRAVLETIADATGMTIEKGDDSDCPTCDGDGVVTAQVPCPDCANGSGKSKDGTKCPICDGDGVVKQQSTCPDCDGSGAMKAAKDDKRPACKTCGGDGKIMGNKRTCPDCKGSGVQPAVGDTEKSLLELAAAKASAPSGVPTPVPDKCPTCKGTGQILTAADKLKDCPDCDGTGDDAKLPLDNKLNAQAGFAGSSDDGNGRLAVDKSTYEELVKAKYGQADRDKMAAGGQAMADGAYPVKDAEDLDNAIHAVGRGGADHNSIRKHIIQRAEALGASDKIPDNWNADGSLNKELIEKDGTVSGPNPFLGGSVSTSTSDVSDAPVADPDDINTPGSADWEGMDAEIATAAATALMEAAELIRQFADREAIEVAAGEGNDIFDTWDAQCALEAVTAAVGMMATLAFHEGVAAQKSEGVAEKSGKRLSNKSVTALAAARDKAGDLANHITKLLGDDDPAKASDDEAEKSIDKEIIKIMDITVEDLNATIASAVSQGVAEATKGKAAMDEGDSVANAKDAKNKAGKKDPKAEMTDLEDEADQGDNDSASTPAKGAAKAAKKAARKAAKAERTPEEVEARKVVKAQKKELEKAEKAAEEVAKNARLAELIGEKVVKATLAIDELKSEFDSVKTELEAVKATPVPGGAVKVRPPEAAQKADQRFLIEAEAARLDSLARNSNDREVRKAYEDRARDERNKLSAL